jgi:hypothetical protein
MATQRFATPVPSISSLSIKAAFRNAGFPCSAFSLDQRMSVSMDRSANNMVHTIRRYLIKMSGLCLSLCLMALISGTVLAQQPAWRLANGTAGNPVRGVDLFRDNPDTMFTLCPRNLLRSTDKGENWDSISWPRADYGGIKVNPTNSQVLYVSIPGIVPESNDPYRSTDGGRTWSLPLFIGFLYAVDVIEFDPIEPGTVYLGVGPGRLYRSSDNGQHWDTLRAVNGLLSSLSIARSNNQILYVGYVRGVSRARIGAAHG